MTSSSRLSSIVGILGFVNGLVGFGRIRVPGRTLGSGLISFLLPHFLSVKDPQTQSSRILVEPHLTDAEFRKAWMNFFCRPGHLAVTPDEFLDFVGHILPQEPYLDLLRITKRNVWGTCPTPRLPYQRDRLLSLCGCCARPRGRAGVGSGDCRLLHLSKAKVLPAGSSSGSGVVAPAENFLRDGGGRWAQWWGECGGGGIAEGWRRGGAGSVAGGTLAVLRRRGGRCPCCAGRSTWVVQFLDKAVFMPVACRQCWGPDVQITVVFPQLQLLKKVLICPLLRRLVHESAAVAVHGQGGDMPVVATTGAWRCLRCSSCGCDVPVIMQLLGSRDSEGASDSVYRRSQWTFQFATETGTLFLGLAAMRAF